MEHLQEMASYVWSAVLDVSLGRVLGWAALLFAGMLMGIAMLNPGGLDVFENSGSAADWAAAIGTWVIGIGAIRFAASDHEMKVSERRERRLSELNSELEIIQSVTRAAQGGSAELADIIRGLNEELPDVISRGIRNSVTLSQLHGALYFLSWNQVQLRLLNPRSATLAKQLEVEGRGIKSLADRLSAGQYFDVLFKSVQDLIERVEQLRTGLSELAELSEGDAVPTKRSIRQLKNQL